MDAEAGPATSRGCRGGIVRGAAAAFFGLFAAGAGAGVCGGAVWIEAAWSAPASTPYERGFVLAVIGAGAAQLLGAHAFLWRIAFWPSAEANDSLAARGFAASNAAAAVSFLWACGYVTKPWASAPTAALSAVHMAACAVQAACLGGLALLAAPPRCFGAPDDGSGTSPLVSAQRSARGRWVPRAPPAPPAPA